MHPFPYSASEIIRNPICLSWGSFEVTSAPKPPPANSDLVWMPPCEGFLKWNVDASVSANQSSAAIGGVLRNAMGNFICIFSSPIPQMEINSAEVLAILRATQISLAFEHLKLSPIIIESDSANAVKWCNENQGGPWNLNFQLNNIRNARQGSLDMVIVHKGRSSNMVADALAKQGLTRADEFLAWL